MQLSHNGKEMGFVFSISSATYASSFYVSNFLQHVHRGPVQLAEFYVGSGIFDTCQLRLIVQLFSILIIEF